MRIIQIIDSLEAGGAERMAVNYANVLANTACFSGLVTTRKQGPLFNQLSEKVSYLYLNKKGILDLMAVSRLRKFVIENKVEIIHAHSTSFFLALLLKIAVPSLKLIWHDHYGNSEFLSKRPSLALRITLPFFSGIVVVNHNLKCWAEQKMHFKNVIYLPNFSIEDNIVEEKTVLKGIEGKRIVALANLRIQKNHFLLLEVAKKIQLSHPEWTFHLVGKDFNDEYSTQIKDLMIEYNLVNSVFIYGSKRDIRNILEQSNIGILTSRSEGFPVALMEYGLYRKPVVVTNVGEVSLLIQNGMNGLLVETGNVELFHAALIKLIENEVLQNDFGKAFQQTITSTYSGQLIVKKYLDWLQQV